MFKTFEYGDPSSETVLIQPVYDHDLSYIESQIEEIRKIAGYDFRLIAVKVNNWNDDLSPWEAPAVFGNDGFGGNAEVTLTEILRLTDDPAKSYIIGGYSLAALFSIWAAYRTDRFCAVAAASPSVWFPGFVEFMKDNAVRTKRVYLSLGDKEEKTRNAVMATVGDRIRESCELLKNTGTQTILEWNSGNHFKEPDIRTAKAFAWCMPLL